MIVLLIAFVVAAVFYVYVKKPAVSKQELPKLAKPEMRHEGVYAVPKNKNFCELLHSDYKGSIIHYVKNGKDPGYDDPVYTAPIPIAEGRTHIIKAVSMQEGYLNSDVAERHYVFALGLPPAPVHGIKINEIERGSKRISGKLNFYCSKAARYISLAVKDKNGVVVKYNTVISRGRWSVTLRSEIQTGDKIRIKAYTKEDIVRFVKVRNKKYKDTMQVVRYSPGAWYPERVVIK